MKIYLTVFFLLLNKIGFDSLKKEHIDSLKPLIETSLSGQKNKDTLNIKRLNELAKNYFESNPDSTIYYGQISIDLSRKINYQSGLANGLLQTGHAYYFKGRFDSAKKDIEEAISIFKKLNDINGLGQCYEHYGKMFNLKAEYKSALTYLNLALNINKRLKNNPETADCYKSIGMVYFGEGQLSSALDYYYKALSIDLKDQNSTQTADIYNNIGDVLQNMGLYPKALDYYKKALTKARQANDLLEIGTADENIGEVLLAQKHYEDAITYLNKSIEIAVKQDDKDGISYINADLGLCYAHKNNFKLAMNYLNTALQVARKNKIIYNQAYALISFATVFNIQKDYKNACKYALEGQTLAAQLGNIWFRTNAELELYTCFAGMGKYKEAFGYSRRYDELKDSLKSNEGLQKLTSYNLTLNFTAKQQQLELQQVAKEALYQQKIKQQKLDAAFVLIIVVMIVISVFYYLKKRRQYKTILMLGDKNAEILEQKAHLDEQTSKLNDSNILKDRLIAILAHDLRAPLSTLKGVFALLLDDTIAPDEMLELVPMVVKKLDYTSDFLDTLLFWINSQMDNFVGSARCFCIKDIVAYETANLREQAATKGISLIENVKDTAFAFADPDSVRIVIRNLVSNALKFSKKDDTIEISARLHNDHYNNETYYVVSVNDTGMGMADDQVKKLFKGKVSSGTGTNNESGTGMGMLFCKDLIEKCGGKIWVTSNEGRGTQFSFTLPVGILDEPGLGIAC